MKQRLIMAIAASIALAMTACGSSSDPSSAGGSSVATNESPDTMGNSIDATVQDFSISLGSASATSGEVTFHITNNGPSTHEFVVVSTDLAPDALPVKDDEVEEDALNAVGEQEDIAANTTTDLSLTLDPGTYVIICNITGHYSQGMHAGLTVT